MTRIAYLPSERIVCVSATQGNAFREFVERCQVLGSNPTVPDELQRPLSRRECDTIFQKANVEVRAAVHGASHTADAVAVTGHHPPCVCA